MTKIVLSIILQTPSPCEETHWGPTFFLSPLVSCHTLECIEVIWFLLNLILILVLRILFWPKLGIKYVHPLGLQKKFWNHAICFWINISNKISLTTEVALFIKKHFVNPLLSGSKKNNQRFGIMNFT